MLIHASDKEIKILEEIPQKSFFKPSGLWYAPKNVWIRYAKKILKHEYKYFYQIFPRYATEKNPNRVLKIVSYDDLDKFTFEYGVNYEKIDWAKVANDYGGIEIIPYLYKWRDHISDPEIRKKYIDHGFENSNDILSSYLFWYAVWDVASGCIWNPNAIKKMRLIN